MATITCALSTLFTSLPALAWLTLILLIGDDDYYWIVYRIVGVGFLAISLMLGGLLPTLIPQLWRQRPWFWLFGQGLPAWIFALLVLGILNLTPLCIGQDNGDGRNDLALCAVQTILVGFVHSLPQVFLLALSAGTGGLIIRRLNAK